MIFKKILINLENFYKKNLIQIIELNFEKFIYQYKLIYIPHILKYQHRQLYHPFHILRASYSPFITSISLLLLLKMFILPYFKYGFHEKINFFFIKLKLSTIGFFLFVIFFCCVFNWILEILGESSYFNLHTKEVQSGLRLGVIYFIMSEIMFFFSLFWTFFHSSLVPAIQIGCVWPPIGIKPFDPLAIPLLNTFILLLSGVTITLCHNFVLNNEPLILKKLSLGYTLFLAFSFTFLQYHEYTISSFSMSDGIYGSIFYMLTGFHGIHVMLGSFLLLICFLRIGSNCLDFKNDRHTGFESSAWYWHFVDVVWLFVYMILYWWGSCLNPSNLYDINIVNVNLGVNLGVLV